MTALLRVFPLKVWLGIGVILAVLALWTAYQLQKGRADRAVIAARSATASTKALDRVATETPAIRSDQEEKQRAVDEIQGADDRLPDGFGADLQRLRDRKRGDDPA